MDVLISVVLPLGLAFIMFTLGVGLTPADFARVGQRLTDAGLTRNGAPRTAARIAGRSAPAAAHLPIGRRVASSLRLGKLVAAATLDEANGA